MDTLSRSQCSIPHKTNLFPREPFQKTGGDRLSNRSSAVRAKEFS